jgi:hypothetical protein
MYIAEAVSTEGLPPNLESPPNSSWSGTDPRHSKDGATNASFEKAVHSSEQDSPINSMEDGIAQA